MKDFQRSNSPNSPNSDNNSPDAKNRYTPFNINKMNKNKWIGNADDNPYSIEWAKKILFENYNCHVVAKDNNKLKLVKANLK